MDVLELINERTGEVIVTRLLKALTVLSRMKGLIGRRRLPREEGLFFPGCNSIHMCLMLFSIDVIYVDAEMNVLKIVKGLKPWIGFSMCSSAHSVIELAKGVTTEKDVRCGDRLIMRPAEQ